MTIKFTTKNKNVVPAAEIQVVHEGKNNYAVRVNGEVFYRKSQFGYACSDAYYLADLSARDMQWAMDNRILITGIAA
jgi:hypothetical protein